LFNTKHYALKKVHMKKNTAAVSLGKKFLNVPLDPQKFDDIAYLKSAFGVSTQGEVIEKLIDIGKAIAIASAKT